MGPLYEHGSKAIEKARRTTESAWYSDGYRCLHGEWKRAGEEERVIYTQTIKDAIAAKKPLAGVYDGYPREFCAHALGRKGAEQVLHVLVFQYGGQTSSGAIGSPGGWRCFEVAKLRSLTLLSGPWHTEDTYKGAGPCIDVVEAEVPY